MTDMAYEKALAEAWASWKSRKDWKLGPGPCFVEAIAAFIGSFANNDRTVRQGLETAIAVVSAEIERVEKAPDSEFTVNWMGDPEVPGGTMSWSTRDEQLHYLRIDLANLKAAAESPLWRKTT